MGGARKRKIRYKNSIFFKSWAQNRSFQIGLKMDLFLFETDIPAAQPYQPQRRWDVAIKWSIKSLLGTLNLQRVSNRKLLSLKDKEARNLQDLWKINHGQFQEGWRSVDRNAGAFKEQKTSANERCYCLGMHGARLEQVEVMSNVTGLRECCAFLPCWQSGVVGLEWFPWRRWLL